MPNKLPSARQLKVGEQIKHILASIFQLNKIHDTIIESHIITITQVRMSADLKVASCYFTILGKKDYERVEAALNQHHKYIRGLCAKELRSLKYIPAFRFFYDDSFDNFSKIDNILRNIKAENNL